MGRGCRRRGANLAVRGRLQRPIFHTTKLYYSKTQKAVRLLSRTLTIWSVSSHVD